MTRARVVASLLVALGTVHGGAARAEVTSLRARIGVDAAEALLASPLPGERLRGLERLGESDSPRAVTRLERALEPGGSATTAEERLVATRALAALADDRNARRVLVRVLGGHATPSSTIAPPPLDVLAERTAALALARAGTDDALAALGKALAVPGRTAEAAHLALVAHPPKDIETVIRAASLSTLALAETLADLGDARSTNRLRELVLQGAESVRAVALPALARLGDAEALILARRWAVATSPAALRTAGARILVEKRDAGAARAVEVLLADAATGDDGVSLATELGSPALVPGLARRLPSTLGEERTRVFRALGASGGKEAVALLRDALGEKESARAAADTLARMREGAAEAALEAALAVPATRRLAVRAGAIREAVLGKKLAGIDGAVRALWQSKDLSDRAAAVAFEVARDPNRLGELQQTAPELAFALAPLAFLPDGDVTPQMAASLATAQDPRTRTALAFCLATLPAAARVPTRELVALVDARNEGSALAARALAARDEERLRRAVLAVLHDPSPLLRAHAALGLGVSPKPDGTGLLESAYRFETDEGVRRAVVQALSQRAPGSRTLALARDLDPDARVRAILDRKTTDTKSDEATSLWLTIPPGRAGDQAVPGVAVVMTEDGLALPVVAAPDGEALVLGLPKGAATLRVAPRGEHDDDEARGARGDEESSRSERNPGP